MRIKTGQNQPWHDLKDRRGKGGRIESGLM